MQTGVGKEALILDVIEGDILFLYNSTNKTNGTSGAEYKFYASNPFESTQSSIAAPIISFPSFGGASYVRVGVPVGATKLVLGTNSINVPITWSVRKTKPSTDYAEGTFALTKLNGRNLAAPTPEQIVDIRDGNSANDLYATKNKLSDMYINSVGDGLGGVGFEVLAIPVKGGDELFMRLPAERAYPFKMVLSKLNSGRYIKKEDNIPTPEILSTSKTGIFKVVIPKDVGARTLYMNTKVVGAGYNFDITESLSVQKHGFVDAAIKDYSNAIDRIGDNFIVDSVARRAISSLGAANDRPISRFSNKKVFALGDSITQGTRGGYVQYLSTAFGTTVKNLGNSGAKVARVVDIITAGEGLAKRDTPTASTVWAVQDFTDLKCAYIMIGTNHAPTNEVVDLMTLPTDTVYDNATTNTYWNKFPDTFVGNLALVVEFLKWKAPKAEIYIVAPPHMAGSGSTPITAIPSVHAGQKAVAERYGVPFINGTFDSGIPWKLMKAAYDATGGYSYDGIHLNERGNEVFGNFLAQRILSAG